MPYNSYFPVGYQPAQVYYPQLPYAGNQQPQQQVPQMPQQQAAGNPQPSSSFIWVQGESGAKSYLVAPGTTVELWDSERQTIYLKSADQMGIPSIKTLDYTIRGMPQNGVPLASTGGSETFATREEINTLAQRIDALEGKLAARNAGRKKPAEGLTDESVV